MVPAVLAGTLLLGCAHGVAQDASTQRGGRMAPPPSVTCDRDQLASWTGTVTAYRRRAEATWIQIHTDWDTVESTSIDHEGASDASAHYLIQGEPFDTGDWHKIERSEGALIDGVRATAWICSDGSTPPVIDWQPHLD
jgi:hypothetical protein